MYELVLSTKIINIDFGDSTFMNQVKITVIQYCYTCPITNSIDHIHYKFKPNEYKFNDVNMFLEHINFPSAKIRSY